jgi:hypothetical protein
MDFYFSEERTSGNKTASQYNEEYQDDFAVIEKICKVVGHQGETFYFLRMFKKKLAPLGNILFDKTLIEVFPSVEDKDGVRVILFLMLQVCILCGGGNPREDFTALWRSYKSFLENKLLKPDENVYIPLVHHLFMLTVAFQGNEVSMLIWKNVIITLTIIVSLILLVSTLSAAFSRLG